MRKVILNWFLPYHWFQLWQKRPFRQTFSIDWTFALGCLDKKIHIGIKSNLTLRWNMKADHGEQFKYINKTQLYKMKAVWVPCLHVSKIHWTQILYCINCEEKKLNQRCSLKSASTPCGPFSVYLASHHELTSLGVTSFQCTSSLFSVWPHAKPQLGRQRTCWGDAAGCVRLRRWGASFDSYIVAWGLYRQPRPLNPALAQM